MVYWVNVSEFLCWLTRVVPYKWSLNGCCIAVVSMDSKTELSSIAIWS